MKTLEQENAELKGLMRKLESQLSDISTRSIVSNGEELKVGALGGWELCLHMERAASCACMWSLRPLHAPCLNACVSCNPVPGHGCPTPFGPSLKSSHVITPPSHVPHSGSRTPSPSPSWRGVCAATLSTASGTMAP